MTREEEVDHIMAGVKPDWRLRWCENPLCGCMGCANRAGGAAISKREWKEWKNRNYPEQSAIEIGIAPELKYKEYGLDPND